MTSKITTSLILDSLSECQNAYHARRQVKTGIPYAYRIRRSSDSDQLDIPFVNTFINRTLLLNFLNGSTGYVTVLYDQCGNDIHLYQNDPAYQFPLYWEDDGYPSFYIYGGYMSSNAFDAASKYTNDLHFFTRMKVIQFDSNGNEAYASINSSGGLSVPYGIVHYYYVHVFYGGYDKFLVKASGAYTADLLNIDNIIPFLSAEVVMNHSREGDVMISKRDGVEVGRVSGTAGPIEFDANSKYFYGSNPLTTSRNCYQRSYGQLQFSRRLKTHEEYAVNTFITNA